MRNKFVIGAMASLKSSVITSHRPDLIVRITVTKLGSINAMGVMGFWGDRGLVAALNLQWQGECGYGQQNQSSNQNSMTCADL